MSSTIAWISFLLAFTVIGAALGAPSANPASLRLVENHKGWGWKAYVLENGLVTAAVIPEIGARLMQFDLAGHPSIWVNPDEVGRTYPPEEDAPWRNFGGYKTWPSPQSHWLSGLGGWPPAPHLDSGRYDVRIEESSPDSVVLATSSPVEVFRKWNSAGLRLGRRYTLYGGSSRLRVEQTITNTGNAHAIWGIWDITQSIVHHDGQQDYDNFWVYFPVRKNSAFGEAGFYVMVGDNRDGQWKSYPSDGIAAVQYLHRSGKVGADSDGGWVCYVDEKDGYAYAKRFDYFPGGTYPDGNSSVEVFTAAEPPYLEVEVMSPLVDLAPGESYTFTEDFLAARVDGPVVAVSELGATKWRLSAQRDDKGIRLTGMYGVFHTGSVRAVVKGAAGQDLAYGSTRAVSPLAALVVDERITCPAEARTAALEVKGPDGKLLGNLDSAVIQ